MKRRMKVFFMGSFFSLFKASAYEMFFDGEILISFWVSLNGVMTGHRFFLCGCFWCYCGNWFIHKCQRLYSVLYSFYFLLLSSSHDPTRSSAGTSVRFTTNALNLTSPQIHDRRLVIM